MNEWGFPSIRELPLLVKTQGWSWELFPVGHNMWIGTDADLNRWLLKLRGKSGAVHEHVYSALAQTLGICTQSSVFLILDESAMPLQGRWHPDKIPHNVGIWKLDEHAYDPCGLDCPLKKKQGAFLPDITNPWDKIEARFLGYMCGMFEPTQSLITTSHLWVQIDNELIFNSWAFEKGKAYDNVLLEILKDDYLTITGAQARLVSLCDRMSDVSDSEIDRIVAVPPEFRCVTRVSKLRRYLKQTRRTAHALARRFRAV